MHPRTRDGRDTLIESLAHQEGVRKTYEICARDGTPVALHVRIQSPGQKKGGCIEWCPMIPCSI